MIATLITLTVLFIAATLIPTVRKSHWVIRVFDFPRVQLCALGISLLIWQIFILGDKPNIFYVLPVLTLCAIIWHLLWILPYTRCWPTEVKAASKHSALDEITILNTNVLMTNRNAKALIQLIKTHKPDIIVTLESDRWWEDALKGITKRYPYHVNCPLDNLYGMHVFSALPIGDERIEYLVEQYVPSIHALFTLKNGVKLQAHFLHPAPPSPSENTYSSERDAELIVVAKKIAKSNQPILVSGDLNDVAWSYTTRLFRKISGLLDPRIGRGMFNTFHTKYWFARWPLDHVFHSEHFTLHKITRLPSIGSDHFPLLTTLVYEATSQDSHVDADKEDQKAAECLTQQEGVNIQDVPKPNKP
ncbi:endonuclease/exonuclease/phosphatase family protein [Pseudoalteromonas sp. MMG024]|uniref:endonuclease/exonuclease/phosphatase family protein n=1 Tax=Pseudoalteromonas sp. MMG024 TaxID=2909980 RepID=UPI001F299B8B|nr:endonuclease/exonuclease/phosphatase family protein [Pseudoalteromonas sp. MMG024]